MSPSYYYLISSLPLLRWGSRSPLSATDFLAQCEGQLDASALAALSAVALLPTGDAETTGIEADWHDWDDYIRNLLARARAGHQHRDVSPILRPERDVFPTERREVDELLANDQPLERERALDQMRWRRLDGLEAGHSFDFDRLVVYRLKLLLLEKWMQFDSESGTRNLGELVEAGLQQAAGLRVATE